MADTDLPPPSESTPWVPSGGSSSSSTDLPPSSQTTAWAPSAAPNTESLGQAVQYGLVSGIPFGKDIGAAVETGESYLPKWARAPGDAPVDQTGEPLMQRLAENRARIGQSATALQAAHPVAYTGSSLASGAALIPGGAVSTLPRAMATGAGIGALAGLGGSALYTYKIRKRTPRY